MLFEKTKTLKNPTYEQLVIAADLELVATMLNPLRVGRDRQRMSFQPRRGEYSNYIRAWMAGGGTHEISPQTYTPESNLKIKIQGWPRRLNRQP